MKEVLENLAPIIQNLWDSGLLTILAVYIARFIQSHTKNKNLDMLAKWAEQAVNDLDKSDNTSADKKAKAIEFVLNRITANKLDGKFDLSQVSGEIEKAVTTLRKKQKELAPNDLQRK